MPTYLIEVSVHFDTPEELDQADLEDLLDSLDGKVESVIEAKDYVLRTLGEDIEYYYDPAEDTEPKQERN